MSRAKKEKIILCLLILLIGLGFLYYKTLSPNKLEGTILTVQNGYLKLQDKTNTIYTFRTEQITAEPGDTILIEYIGHLNPKEEIQSPKIRTYTLQPSNKDSQKQKEDGLFHEFYEQAYQKMQELTLEEKIGQLLLARYPGSPATKDLKTYKLSGFVFFEKDFQKKNKTQIKTMIDTLQKNSAIPLLAAVDEEGGQVIRLSRNKLLIKEPFKSSQELYKEGGFALIKEDTLIKSQFLSNLGINLNLAPVVDVSTNPKDYMYARSFGQNTELTKEYAKTVIEASKQSNVSYTLKHFPGYGNNVDTHTSKALDNRSLDQIKSIDLPPFIAGINAQAEAILISHNTVTSLDAINPASLSPKIHGLLREELKFTGVTITDDLDMGATKNIENAIIKAIEAGNDLIITTNYSKDFATIKNAITTKTLSEDQIEEHVTKVLAWKYYKGLFTK